MADAQVRGLMTRHLGFGASKVAASCKQLKTSRQSGDQQLTKRLIE